MENNRNYIVAIVLSVLILFGWQYFYMGPRMEAQRQPSLPSRARRTWPASRTPMAARLKLLPTPNGAVPPAGTTAGAVSRDAALAASGRVASTRPIFPARSTCAARASTI